MFPNFFCQLILLVVVEQLVDGLSFYLSTLGCHLVSDMVYRYYLLNQRWYQEGLQHKCFFLGLDWFYVFDLICTSFCYFRSFFLYFIKVAGCILYIGVLKKYNFIHSFILHHHEFHQIQIQLHLQRKNTSFITVLIFSKRIVKQLCQPQSIVSH